MIEKMELFEGFLIIKKHGAFFIAQTDGEILSSVAYKTIDKVRAAITQHLKDCA